MKTEDKKLRDSLYKQFADRWKLDYCDWCCLPGQLIKTNPALFIGIVNGTPTNYN